MLKSKQNSLCNKLKKKKQLGIKRSFHLLGHLLRSFSDCVRHLNDPNTLRTFL